jgi:hypothetical protein
LERERSVSDGSGLVTLSPPIDPPRRRRSGLRASLREPWSALWTSRLVVWVAGVMGVLWFYPRDVQPLIRSPGACPVL